MPSRICAIPHLYRTAPNKAYCGQRVNSPLLVRRVRASERALGILVGLPVGRTVERAVERAAGRVGTALPPKRPRWVKRSSHAKLRMEVRQIKRGRLSRPNLAVMRAYLTKPDHIGPKSPNN